MLLPKTMISGVGLMGLTLGTDVSQMVTTNSRVLKDVSKEPSNWTWVEKHTNYQLKGLHAVYPWILL